MDKVDFYDDLNKQPPDTIQMAGLVLMHKNKNKWHLCKKGGMAVTHACGNGGPTDPNRTGYTSDDYYTAQYEKSADIVEPVEALEQGRLCSFCERIIKDEFDFEQVTVTVGASEREDIERFVKLRKESLK